MYRTMLIYFNHRGPTRELVRSTAPKIPSTPESKMRRHRNKIRRYNRYLRRVTLTA
ncbi:MAG: hypothetical protein AAB573_01760 [Patescibacteria group bacterium]